MMMPGRKYSADGSYRYGFNGKEKDNDISSLTAYDYGFRIYNPALGRFLSVDPLAQSYPWYTPYQFAGNKPIIAIDLDGLEEIEVQIVAKNLYNTKLQNQAKDLAKNNPSALAAMQQKAWNTVVTDLDAVVAKHFDPKHNAAISTGQWSGITKEVGEYFSNSASTSPLTIWNSYKNYDDDAVTTDEISKTLDEKVRELINDHFYASAAGTDFYYKYLNSISQAKDPNQKAALIEERVKTAKNKWADVFHAMQVGLAEVSLSLMGGGETGTPNARVFSSGASGGFTIASSKFDYFFGKVVTGDAKNIMRSAQNLKDLTKMGITNQTQLTAIFKKAFESGTVVSTNTTKYGTTISKMVKVGDNGSVSVGFFYKGGNMSSTPSVTTIIPKTW